MGAFTKFINKLAVKGWAPVIKNKWLFKRSHQIGTSGLFCDHIY